jgi:peptide/nickel transport system permease protein
MGRYILRRVLYAIPIAFGVSVVCFSLVYLAPGDPLQTVLPPDATAETIAIVKKAYGFDKPLPTQFLIWLGRVVTGDFGMSIATRRPVILEVTGALANTGLLAMFAVPIAFSIGYTMGAVAGSFPGRWIDRVVTGAAVSRRQPAELLGRHRAGHRFRGRTHGVAGGRDGTERGRATFIFCTGATHDTWFCRSSPCR